MPKPKIYATHNRALLGHLDKGCAIKKSAIIKPSPEAYMNIMYACV